VTDQAAGKVDDLVGNTAVQHELTGEDEEGNGQEGKHIHARDHHLDGGLKRQAFHGKGGQTGQANGKRHGHAQQQEGDEAQTEYGQCHEGTTFVPANWASICSMENRTIATPEISTGR
jgi:hypothetical protein